MIDKLFKNDFLSSYVYKASKAMFYAVTDGFSLKCSCGLKVSSALLDVTIVGGNDFKLYIDEILIFDSKECLSKTIPVVIDNDSVISAAGYCDKLTMVLYGAKFLDVCKSYVLPMSKVLVNYTGSGVQLLSYSNDQDFIDGSFNSVSSLNNVCSVQTVNVQGVESIGVLQIENGVYYCDNSDNYTFKLYVCDNTVTKATILRSGDLTLVVYIKNGLKYRVLENGVLGDETDIKVSNNRTPVDFGVVENYQLGTASFVMKWANGEFGVFVYSKGNFVQKLTLKGGFVKISVFGNFLRVCALDDYKAKITEYEVYDDSQSCVLINKTSYVVNNCDNVFWVDKMIVSNMGNYTIK